MDPHLLRTFAEVARLGSFSAAARELGYTQSAVSQHVAALEADLGVELLGRRPVSPTEAGARLLDHTGPLLARLAAARADVVRVARTPPDRLVIGAAGALALGGRAVRALDVVRARTPRAEVELRLLDPAQVVRGIADGALDAGLVAGTVAPTDPLPLPDAAGLSVVRAGEDPLMVLLPADHPLAGRGGLRLADLADARWLDAPDAAVDLAALRAATGSPFPVGMRYRGADSGVVRQLAAAGHGLAALPGWAAGWGGDVPAGSVVAVPLVAPRLVHRVEVLTRPEPAGAARIFAEALAADV
ncbi:LysR family transcriptional regulator [Actinacidiphila yanglinensis]|nr:LysR family transcriptional regulator [Actinacidiphila yanglinensis]